MKKRLVSLLMAVIMVCSVLPTAFAATDEATQAAQALYELGLFKGTGTNADGTPIFDLDKTPTRNQAIIMLVRLLGKEGEALAGTWDIPFTDVTEAMRPYIGYAYTNGLTNGYTATTYNGTAPIKANQYIAFVLRALGYASGKDFEVGTSYLLSDELGITDGTWASKTAFTRGDVAEISLKAHEVQETLATAPYFGLPADIKWISDPADEADYINNLKYLFLFGNYYLLTPNSKGMTAMTIDINNHKTSTINDLICALAHTYPELMGAYCNMDCHMERAWAQDGELVLYADYHYRGAAATLTVEEVYAQQLAALDRALEVKEMLHSSGKIKEGMSELQIARAYESYLLGLNVRPGVQKGDPSCVEYDSAYAALVNRKADCVGRAAAFNLLMNVEGITAQGVGGSFHGTTSGHVMSRVVLDGKEYFSDWGNRRKLGSYETYEKQYGFWFDPETLAIAREMEPAN